MFAFIAITSILSRLMTPDHAQRALQYAERLLSMQSQIHDNLERRISEIEHLMRSHGLDTRLPPPSARWTVPQSCEAPQPEAEDDIVEP